MRLYEYEGKALLQTAGFAVPQVLERAPLAQLTPQFPSVLKAQTLSGNRARAGLIHLCKDETQWKEAQAKLAQALEKESQDVLITQILQEEIVSFDTELYLALRYDTKTRQPILLFHADGGSGIEERGSASAPATYPLTIESPVEKLPQLHPNISAEWLKKLIDLFFAQDMSLLEINPLAVKNGELLVLDAKIELDDTAAFRHPEWEELYPPRTLFSRQPTERELQAKAVNASDHRGIAGASYFEFTGTIGVLASGGGASLLAMDALLASSLKPANYTEYSGNPPREKVKALTDVVLSQKNLEGLWVIGGHANFTDIYETLMGVMDGIEAAGVKPGFPIVIRRGGPRLEEAYVALKERADQLGLQIHTYTSDFPITDTVAVLEKAVEIYRSGMEHA